MQTADASITGEREGDAMDVDHTGNGPLTDHRPAARLPVADPAERQIAGFVEADYRNVVSAVALWCGSADDAADAVADALGRAWERLDRGVEIDNMAAWVTRVAMNIVRSTHRARGVRHRKRHLVGVGDSAPDQTDVSAVTLDLREALALLTDRQREVLAMRYGLDLPVAEIARQLELSLGTVKATLHQSRLRLSTLLSDDIREDLK